MNSCFSVQGKSKSSRDQPKPLRTRTKVRCVVKAAHGFAGHPLAELQSSDFPWGVGTCPVCAKSFRRLREHFRTHTGETPYQCEICGRRFKVGAHIARHRRTHLEL